MNDHSDNLFSIVDKIIHLSKTDPTQVENYTREVISSEIIKMADGDPERLKKLQQIQWKIDGQLRKYKDPIARSNKMQEIFWEGVREFITALKSS